MLCPCRYVLITPLVASDWGRAALVNRGWVPKQWRTDPKFRLPHEEKGQVHQELNSIETWLAMHDSGHL